MVLENLQWVQPCGCGGSADLRAEVKTGSGQFRIKKTDAGYFVQRFSTSGHPLKRDESGAPQYEQIDAGELALLLDK